MPTRLMEKVLQGSLGYELVLKGFTLYEMEDGTIILEYRGKTVGKFGIHATIVKIRDTADLYLRNRDLRGVCK